MTVVTRRVPIMHGLTWFGAGWRGFVNAPGLLIGVMLLWFIIAVGLGMIPLLGSLISSLITPALFGGYLIMSRAAIDDTTPTLEQFFGGLTRPDCRGDSLVLGLLLLIGHIAAFLLTAAAFALFSVVIAGMNPMELMTNMRGAAEEFTLTVGMLLVFGLTLVVALIPYTILAMCLTYAAPLVLDNRGSAMTAVSLSFNACLRNILPLSLFALVYLVLAVIAAIPLGLGLFIFIPVSMAALAQSYSEIFTTVDEPVMPEV